MPGTSEQPPASDRFRLERALASGGMATVWLAWDPVLEVRRAIKVLQPRFAAIATTRERFLVEARTMARLHHPHILSVHDIGMFGPQPYMVMDWMEGGAVSDRLLRDGPLGPQQAIQVTCAVLDALAEAHDHGVIHRDIKPHNILLDGGGHPKVADFGIAAVRDGRASVTRTGIMMGTPSFMAPEQQLDAKSSGPKADLYATGATLYALLTAKDPYGLFAAESQEARLSTLPPELSHIIRAACSFAPAARPQTASTMAALLREVARALPDDPPETPPLTSTRDTLPPPSPLPTQSSDKPSISQPFTLDPDQWAPPPQPETLAPESFDDAPPAPLRPQQPRPERPRPPARSTPVTTRILGGALFIALIALATLATSRTGDPTPAPGPTTATEPDPPTPAELPVDTPDDTPDDTPPPAPPVSAKAAADARAPQPADASPTEPVPSPQPATQPTTHPPPQSAPNATAPVTPPPEAAPTRAATTAATTNPPRAPTPARITPAQVDRVGQILRAEPAIQGCFRQLAARTGRLPARTEVRFTLTTAGRFTQASVARADHSDAPFSACLASAVEGAIYADYTGPTNAMTYPFTL